MKVYALRLGLHSTRCSDHEPVRNHVGCHPNAPFKVDCVPWSVADLRFYREGGTQSGQKGRFWASYGRLRTKGLHATCKFVEESVRNRGSKGGFGPDLVD